MKNEWQIDDPIDSEDTFKSMFIEAVESTPEVEDKETNDDDSKTKEIVINNEKDFINEFGGAEVETNSEQEAPKSLSIDAVFLKAQALLKAEKYDIELPEDMEWTLEAYEALEDQIDEYRLAEKYENFKQSDQLINTLLTIAENEGDATEVLNLFSQKRDLSEIDTSTAAGKVEKIKKYYKEVEGKSENWINKQIRLLQTSEDGSELEDEFNTISADYDAYFQEETERRVKEAETAKINRENLINKRKESFNKTLESKKIPKKEVNELIDFVYDDKAFINRTTNQTLSGFDAKILEAKQDPEKLSNLVMYLKDPELFIKKALTEQNNKTNESKFKKIVEQVSSSNKSVEADKSNNNNKRQFNFFNT